MSEPLLELLPKSVVVSEEVARFDEKVEKIEPASFRFHVLVAIDDFAQLSTQSVSFASLSPADVAADAHFLQVARVREQCARCHAEFEEEEG